MQKVVTMCGGKQFCRVQASNGVFGDPCVGTYKYLRINYRCIKKPTSSIINVCEHRHATLRCGNGQVLEILGAKYGRTDRTTCRNPAIRTTNCGAASSMQKVVTMCGGKQFCRVQASNGVFGDPCVGTYKYLRINYRCIKKPTSSIINVCEHRHATLRCGNGQVLEILGAKYGRTDRTTCRNPAIRTTNCGAASSMQKVVTMCGGKQFCRVQASNGVFGDPCVGTYKYLRINYRCIKKPTSSIINVCEHRHATLRCSNGQVLEILGAKYGRTDRTTCRNPAIRTTNCGAASSMQKVVTMCGGKQVCRIQASNGVFGDPCVGTYKYLRINYRCIKNPSAFQTVNVCEGKSQYITCPRDRSMFITRANYGRTDRKTCPHPSIRTTNCHSRRTLQAVKRRCDGTPICRLHAVNSVFGDPCFGTYKYLQVTYQCRRRYASKRSIVCEGQTASLNCPIGYKLKIRSARYGRTNRSSCRNSAMRNIHCVARRSLQIAQSRCNARRFCRLPATNGVFGDPCFGTYKYLDITHQCI
ncbi:uncharacterized protein LOC135682221 isoform X2 [Rhopilema esculentum]